MFFQTLLQSLLKRKKAGPTEPAKDLSPMAQSIMQKMAEHDKNKGFDTDVVKNSDSPANK
jgi:hypothetical protein